MPEFILNEIDPEMQMLQNNREDGYNYRQRRHDDWNENYQLYRDKVIYNRLTQRQTINLPVMKTEIRTLLKDVDDLPILYFENLDNDKTAEVFKNEYWKVTDTLNNMSLQDIVDKRQVLLFGRSSDQWQVKDGKVKQTILDPMDLLVSKYIDPYDLNSSRFMSHINIYVPLSQLENNTKYDAQAIYDLKVFYATEMGLIKAAENEQNFNDKAQKLAELGVLDAYSPVLGEVLVEIELQFVFRDRESRKGKVFEDQIFLYTIAEGMAILLKQPLEEAIGETKDHFWRTHYPYNTWADDLERQDFWSDGVGDIIRTPNKVLNTLYAQLVENRALRNMNMNVFNSSIEGFVPQTWTPQAWGMYGIPLQQGQKLSDAFMQLPVADLSESLDEMQFIIGMVEKGTGATQTQQGVQNQKQITLGEVQLALGEAKERVKGMSKFYTPAWENRGLLFIKLLEAAGDKLDAVTIYKKGKNTSNIYSREIDHNDWKSELGYYCKVWSRDEKEANDTERLNKLNAVRMNMPDNPVVLEESNRQMLEFAEFSPDKVNEAMKFEEEKRNAMMSMVQSGMLPAQDPNKAQGQASAPAQPMQIPAQTGQ